jgi:LysM repeat protein
MEPIERESNPLKPQPTGGLKLMTVFIAVLALHVLVIGGFTVWHLVNPANVDGDLAADKNHKSSKLAADTSIGDMAAGDSATGDKTAGATPPATDSDSASANDPTGASTSGTTVPPANPTLAAPAASTPATPPTVSEDASEAAANAPAAQVTANPTPIHHGPVVNPPDNLAPPADASAPDSSTPTSVATDTTAAAPAPADSTSYTVKRGDSLARIAHHHHITVANLRSANSLAGNNLRIGQKLVIPDRAAPAAAVSVATTADAAPAAPRASRHHSAVPEPGAAPMAQPVQGVDQVNALPLASSATPRHAHHAAAASGHHFYTVMRGDTLTKIAKRYHTTTNAIMAANNLTNAGRLSIGQKLHIPAHESRASATADQAAPREEAAPRATAKGQLANYTP